MTILKTSPGLIAQPTPPFCMSAPAAAPRLLSRTLTPFLYPCLDSTWTLAPLVTRHAGCRQAPRRRPIGPFLRRQSTVSAPPPDRPSIDVTQYDHLDPQPLDYTTQPFIDSCSIVLHAGGGGNGCISFLREKFIANGPPNGGDGGTGGNIFIQAVSGETSLHKLKRRSIIKATKGRNGEGGMRGGKRGEDVLLTVPVGTVVREVSRVDPMDDGEGGRKKTGYGRDLEDDVDDGLPDQTSKWRRDRWLVYPGALPRSFSTADFPALPRPRRSQLAAQQPSAPLRLDLNKPMETPMLLAAGAMGGFGNPHFATKSIPRPKFATKGDEGMRIHVQLELKLLADVGLVGLPNAGKSTLLRALTKSRTRVGDWAFTTLAPSIGTVVLDDHTGRVKLDAASRRKTPRANFTIADIPGLIEDAHLDKGLGLGFLRHVERAAVMAFVIDLSAGDAIAALKALWREVVEFQHLREQELSADARRMIPDDQGLVGFQPLDVQDLEDEPIVDEDAPLVLDREQGRRLPPLMLPPISSKPWFVVATKADLPETQENFLRLREYLAEVQEGRQASPSGKKNAWRRNLHAIPVSAIKKEGVSGIPEVVLSLLDS